MRVFKTRQFNKWASKEGLVGTDLLHAVEEITRGLVEAHLGAYLYQKRIGLSGTGKRGGARTLLAYQSGGCCIFIYGFAKAERGNISQAELKALKRYARELVSYNDKELNRAVQAGALIEVNYHE